MIVDIVGNKMGSDILLLDLAGVTLIADYFVIATGESTRQLKAIAESVVQQLKSDHEIRPLGVEGTADSGWVLIDYGSVVVHLFSEAQRNRYQLEQLWSEARTVVRMV